MSDALVSSQTAFWLCSSCPDIIDSVLVDYEQPASDAILVRAVFVLLE